MLLRTILCATDFSEPSEFGFRLACALARDHQGTVVVLYVDPPPLTHGEVVARRQENGYREDLWEMLRRNQAPGGAVPVSYRLEEGEPVAGILRVADEVAADLIVMGTHGRTGLGRLVLGSVAEAVVRRAACPVLTVKIPTGHATTEAAASSPGAARPAGGS